MFSWCFLSPQNRSLLKLRQGLLSAFLSFQLLVCLFPVGDEGWRTESGEGLQRAGGGLKLQAGGDSKTDPASAK